jgi:glutamate carboxypeptidase
LTTADGFADSVAQAAERARPELVEQLLRLTGIDAPSGNAVGLAAAADSFAAELAALGGEVERHTRNGFTHLSTRLGPDGDRHVLILCHYDTVWPAGTAAERPGRFDGERLSGPGTFDMRGGIVAVLGALRLLGARRLPVPVQLLLTADEEVGSDSSEQLILDLAGDASLVLVPEPPLPGGGLKTARKGWSGYTIEVSGRAAHAGLEPEKGVSAIDELLDILREVLALGDPRLGTTVNIGAISGGTRPNVVAANASAEIEVRAISEAEQRRTDEALMALRATREGATVTLREEHGRPPMERTPEVAAAAERAQQLARLLGLELAEGAAGGTGDANLLAPLHVRLLDGLGPDGGGAHALHEHVLVDSLVQRTALIALLLADAGPASAEQLGRVHHGGELTVEGCGGGAG